MKKFALVMLVFAIAVSFAFANGSKESAKVVTLKVGGLQSTEDVSTLALYKMAEIAEKKSNGTLKLEIYPASQLGNANAEIEATSMGTQDMFVDAGWIGTYVPDKVIDAMWFIYDGADHYAKYIDSELNHSMEKQFEDQLGIKVIASNWYRAPRSFCSKKPLNSLADFKGLVIRIPDLPGYVESVDALGGKSTQVAWAEVYMALQQGVVDAAEGPFDNLYTMNFYEAAPYITITNHLRDSMQVMINSKIFDKLSAEHQQILVEAAKEAGDWYSNEITAGLEQVKQTLIEKGAIVKEMSPAGLKGMKDCMTKRINDLDAKAKYWKTGMAKYISDLK